MTLFLAAFVVLGLVKPVVPAFAGVDLLAALRTASALRHAERKG